jgi:hypothetical protein
MLEYEVELFDKYNHEELTDDQIIDNRNELLEIEIQNIMEEYCK